MSDQPEQSPEPPENRAGAGGGAAPAEPRSPNRSRGALKHTLNGPLGDLVTPLEGIEWDALR